MFAVAGNKTKGKIIVRTMNVGMCNQLFTYAYARYLAEKNQMELWLDYSHITKADMKHNAGFDDALGNFSLEYTGIITKEEEYLQLTGEKGEKFEKILAPKWVRRRARGRYYEWLEKTKGKKLRKKGIHFNLIVDNESVKNEDIAEKENILFGYWQIPQFARKIKDILRNEIVGKYQLSEQLNAWKTVFEKDNAVCVHIRRGDYVGDQMHEVCTDSYYEKAMELYRNKMENPIFYVFSDDKNYVRELYRNTEDVVVVENIENDYEELILMSSFSSYIISNSSFSWWAQFLGDAKNVIAPNRWYGDENKKSLLYEEHWEKI